MAIKFSAILSVHAALAAVNNDGYALQYVKDQTPDVVLAAVTSNGDALRYVLDFELFKSIAIQLNIKIKF